MLTPSFQSFKVETLASSYSVLPHLFFTDAAGNAEIHKESSDLSDTVNLVPKSLTTDR